MVLDNVSNEEETDPDGPFKVHDKLISPDKKVIIDITEVKNGWPSELDDLTFTNLELIKWFLLNDWRIARSTNVGLSYVDYTPEKDIELSYY